MSNIPLLIYVMLFASMLPTYAVAGNFFERLGNELGGALNEAGKTIQNKLGAPKQQPEEKDLQPSSSSTKKLVTNAPDLAIKPDDIREIQRLLNQAGYNAGPVDGKYGSTTSSAIRTYQKANGLSTDGMPSLTLLYNLRRTYQSNASTFKLSTTTNSAFHSDESRTSTINPPQDNPGQLEQQYAPPSASTDMDEDNTATRLVSDSSADDLTTVPIALLIYKYAPEKITDESLKKSLQQVIGHEQYEYRQISQQKNSPYKNNYFLFSKDQIVDRHVEFASEDLLSDYKAFLKNEAATIPNRLRLESYLRIDYFKYDNGVINSNTSSGQGADVFFKYSIEDKLKKASIPNLGAREILVSVPTIKFRWKSDSTSKLPTYPEQLILAIDRIPSIPPIPVPRKNAEKMFMQPNTLSCLEDRTSDNCIASKQYTGFFRLSYLVTPEGFIDGTNILAININKVEVYDPYGNLIKSFLPPDLQLANDANMAQRAALKNKDQEATVREQTLAATRAAMRAKVQAFDINGLSLSMPYSEAEAMVRRKLEVVRVRKSKSTGKHNPYFSDMTQFENIDGTVRVMLLPATPGSEKLVGIGRWLDLPEGTTIEDVKHQLIAKYGKPTQSDAPYRLSWHGFEDNQLCMPSVDWGGEPILIEGVARDQFEQYGSFMVSEYYALSDNDKKTRNKHLKDLRDSCSTLLTAIVQQSRMLVVLLDISSYASENLEGSKSAVIKLNL